MRAYEFIIEASSNDDLKQELEKDWMPQGYVPPPEGKGKNISLPRDEKGHPIEPGLEQPLVSPEDFLLPFAGSLGRKATQAVSGLTRSATSTKLAPQAVGDFSQKSDLANKYPWQQRTKFSSLPPEGPFSQQTYRDAIEKAWQQTPTTQGPFDTFKDLVKAPKINIGDTTLMNPLATRNIGKRSMSAEELAQKEFERLYGRKGSARDLEDAAKLDALWGRFVGRGYQTLPPKEIEIGSNVNPNRKLGPPYKDQQPKNAKKEIKRQIDKMSDWGGGTFNPAAIAVDTTRLAADYAKNWSASNKDKKQK